MTIKFTVELLYKWRGRAFVALSDQSIISLVAFIQNVLCARYLSTAEYGELAICLIIQLILFSLPNAFILEPMGVLFAQQSESNIKYYEGKIIIANWIISIVMSLVLFLILPYFVTCISGLSIASLAISSPFIFHYALMRRICYQSKQPDISMHANGIYGVVVLASIVLLNMTNSLTVFSSICTTAVGAICGCIVIFFKMPKKIIFRSNENNFKNILVNHLHFGKWVALAAIFYAFSYHYPYFVFSNNISIEEIGQLRAQTNIIQPWAIFGLAINSLFTPVVSNIIHKKDNKSINQSIVSLQIVMLIIAVIAYILTYCFLDVASKMIYGTKYSGITDISFPLAIFALSNLMSIVPGIIIRACRRPAFLAISYSFSSAFCVLLSGYLSEKSGLYGAAMCLAIASFISALCMYILGVIGSYKMLIKCESA